MPRLSLLGRLRRFWRWLRRPRRATHPRRLLPPGWRFAPGGVLPFRTRAGVLLLPYRLLVSPRGRVWVQTRRLTRYEHVHVVQSN